jgi:ABC-type phosphate transport system permease subunit
MRDLADRWMPRFLGGAALLSAMAVLAILAFLVYSAVPFFWTDEIGTSVMTGWQPYATPPSYGIGPMVVGSLLLAVLAASASACSLKGSAHVGWAALSCSSFTG